MSLVWLITGSSSGFGLRLAKYALARGDRVIATARTLAKLETATASLSAHKDNLRLHELDVTESEDTIAQKVQDAVKTSWGQIDVVVNNAGFGVLGFLEEGGSKHLKHLFDANVFGAMNVTNAVLPFMRERKTGTVVMIGSRSEWGAHVPCRGPYGASKAAIRVLAETLSVEVNPFGIRVLIVEPGAFRTEGIYGGGFWPHNTIADYDPMRKQVQEVVQAIPGKEKGDPDKAMQAIVDVVHGAGAAKDKNWPFVLFLGDDAEQEVRNKCKVILDSLDEWKDVTRGVSFEQ